MSKSKKIAKYARMASDELHEEYMATFTYPLSNGQAKDIMSEVIDKLDYIQAMANDNWYRKLIRKWKYRK